MFSNGNVNRFDGGPSGILLSSEELLEAAQKNIKKFNQGGINTIEDANKAIAARLASSGTTPKGFTPYTPGPGVFDQGVMTQPPVGVGYAKGPVTMGQRAFTNLARLKKDTEKTKADRLAEARAFLKDAGLDEKQFDFDSNRAIIDIALAIGGGRSERALENIFSPQVQEAVRQQYGLRDAQDAAKRKIGLAAAEMAQQEEAAALKAEREAQKSVIESALRQQEEELKLPDKLRIARELVKRGEVPTILKGLEAQATRFGGGGSEDRQQLIAALQKQYPGLINENEAQILSSFSASDLYALLADQDALREILGKRPSGSGSDSGSGDKVTELKGR